MAIEKLNKNNEILKERKSPKQKENTEINNAQIDSLKKSLSD